jgi:hypothetical protein
MSYDTARWARRITGNPHEMDVVDVLARRQ